MAGLEAVKTLEKEAMGRMEWDRDTRKVKMVRWGVSGALVAYCADPVTATKSIGAVCSVGALAGDIIPAMGSLSGVSPAILTSAKLFAAPGALTEAMNTYSAGKAFYAQDTRTMKDAGKVIAPATKALSKTIEFTVGLHENRLVDLGSGLYPIKVTKCLADVTGSTIAHFKAKERHDTLQQATRPTTISEPAFEAVKRESWWNVVRSIAALALHLFVALITVLGVVVNALISLFFITCFIVTSTVHHFFRSEAIDALGDDLAIEINNDAPPV